MPICHQQFGGDVDLVTGYTISWATCFKWTSATLSYIPWWLDPFIWFQLVSQIRVVLLNFRYRTVKEENERARVIMSVFYHIALLDTHRKCASQTCMYWITRISVKFIFTIQYNCMKQYNHNYPFYVILNIWCDRFAHKSSMTFVNKANDKNIWL